MDPELSVTIASDATKAATSVACSRADAALGSMIELPTSNS